MSTSEFVYLAEGSPREMEKLRRVLLAHGIAAHVGPKRDCRTPT